MTPLVAALGTEALARIVKTSKCTITFATPTIHTKNMTLARSNTIFFKIDLYEEPDFKNPNGEPVVTRVLTIMLAEEY